MSSQPNGSVTQYVHLGNHQKIAYCEYGDPNGKPVFYFHGTPGSRYEPVFGDQAGKEHGYRLIAMDRPGIGQSDYAKGRTLLDWPNNVINAAEQMGIGNFGVIGVSGGGPYALACSYAIPERLDFSVLMGSWGPVTAEPKLWDEMAPLDRFFGKLSKGFPWTFYIPFSLLGYSAKWMSPRGFMKSIESSMSAADRQLMADDVMVEHYAEDVKEAFRQGVRGPADDAIILYGHWGFKVENIQVNVHLFHGEEDKFAPYNYALYFDQKIPHTKLHSYPGKGHLFLIKFFDEIFEQIERP